MARMTRWLPVLTGIPFTGLVVASVLTTSNTPGSGTTAGQVLRYYQQPHSHYAGAAAFLLFLGIIFGLFFYAQVRALLRRHEASEWLASAMFGGAVVFALSGLISAGALGTLADKPDTLSASAAQALNLIQNDLTYPVIAAGLAVLYLAAGAVILRSRVLPPWWGWVTVLLGLLAVSFFLAFIAFFAMAAWVVITAVMMTMEARA